MPIHARVRAILDGFEFSIGEEEENEAKEIK
jgi:hypothetical protein